MNSHTILWDLLLDDIIPVGLILAVICAVHMLLKIAYSGENKNAKEDKD